MNYNINYLECYQGQTLIPCHPWNKKINGAERGRTPLDIDWNNREYPKGDAETWKGWIKQGYNLAYKIPKDEFVLDIDPRNIPDSTTLSQVQQKLCELLDLWDWEELVGSGLVVQTGRGGYHIYCKLSDEDLANISSLQIKHTVNGLVGVDVLTTKCMAAGSKHPNGEHYKAVNDSADLYVERAVCTKKLLAKITYSGVGALTSDEKVKRGWGAINGTQLTEYALSKLAVEDYANNDVWFRLMASAHFATAGEGLAEFLEWSLSDPNYKNDANTIATRWESLHDKKGVNRTALSLAHELQESGLQEEANNLRAVIDFYHKDEFIEKIDDKDSLEQEMLKSAKIAASKVDIEDIAKVNTNAIKSGRGVIEDVGKFGTAIAFCKELIEKKKASGLSVEDKMQAMRLIRASSVEESIEAQEILTENKIMSQGNINKRMKALDSEIIDSINEILANTAIEAVFSNGKHIITEPNGIIYIYSKTHWIPITEDYLGKLIYGVLDTLKTKIKVETSSEVSMVKNAIASVRMRCSISESRLFNVHRFKPVVNCKNGEVWIDVDNGLHVVQPHNPKSYLINRLDVEYDEFAKCPLWLDTLQGIFANYPDTEEIIDYVGEICGYIIQPYKPNAKWWMFKGPGGDGKSTILKILNAVLGKAFYSANQKILDMNSGSTNNHATMGLIGKLLVNVEELAKGRKLKDDGLKLLSENRKMSANPKNKEEFDFNYVGTLIMCCNFFPTITDVSEGTQRRANIIPFNRQFEKHGIEDADRVKNILSNSGELSGVLNWMLAGYRRYKERGDFKVPKSCLDAKEEWLVSSNHTLRFLRENMKITGVATNTNIGALELYNHYNRWCMDENVVVKGRNQFYQDLKDFGLSVRRLGGKNTVYGGFYQGGSDFEDIDNNLEWE